MHPLNNVFLRWWCYQLKTYDCDPALYLMNYLFNRFEFNIEQKYWLCWLYANTYHLPTAWVIWNEFPDFENVGIERLTKFQMDNKSHLPYQKDQKWLRGRLPETFAAYRSAVTTYGKGQHGFWEDLNNSFSDAWQLLLSKAFPRFGRYTAWFYLQALNECCGHQFVPPSMFLDDPSAKQPRLGVLLGMKVPEASIHDMEQWADDTIIYAHGILADELHILPVQPDRFSMETSLCAFSKLIRGRSKGRYLGYYLDRMAEDIHATSSHDWNGIEWDALWDGRNEILLPELNRGCVNPSEMDVFPQAGRFASDPQLIRRLDLWYAEKLAASCL